MLRHYFATALRQLWRNRAATTFNLIGLVIGLGCFVFSQAAVSLVSGRGSAAAFRNTVILCEHMSASGMAPETMPMVSRLLAPALKTELPKKDRVVRFIAPLAAPVRAGATKNYFDVAYADPDIIRVFNLPGAAPNALDRPRSVILSEKTARILFGTQTAIGQPISVDGVGGVVTAVTKLPAQPSPLAGFDVLASWDIRALATQNIVRVAWYYTETTTYVATPPGTTIQSLNAVLTGFAGRHIAKGDITYDFSALPAYRALAAALDSEIDTAETGISMLILLNLLGVLILGVAIANYINLSTAQIVRRLREARIRRILGAMREDLLLQHGMETFLTVGIAVVLSVILAVGVLPAANALIGRDTVRLVMADRVFWGDLAVAILTTIVLAGLYPALLFASLPIGGSMAATRSGGGWVRPALTTLQFASAAALLMLALVMNSQNHVLRSLDDNTAGLVSIDAHTGIAPEEISGLRAALSAIPQVRSVTVSNDDSPWSGFTQTEVLRRAPVASANGTSAVEWQIGEGYFNTLGLPILAGRDFSVLRHNLRFSRKSLDQNVVIDRKLANKLGWATLAAAIDQTIYFNINLPGTPYLRLHVIGVVETHPTELTAGGSSGGFYMFVPERVYTLLVRIDPNQIPAAINAINHAWEQVAPLSPLKLEFISDRFAQAYRMPQEINRLVTVLVCMALALALGGLAGMAIEVARARLREIAIRKMLGASSAQAAGLLLWEFAKPVVLANLVAWPVAFLAARLYLSLFIARAALTPWPFILGLFATLLVAGAIVAGETLRAARISPAKVLRYE